MCLFFAVTIPPEVTGGIVTESKKISAPSLCWVAPDNLHFTLRFLGETDKGRVAELISAGQETAEKHHSFLLAIAGAGFFPDEERPRIFWAGVGEGEKKIIFLANNLSATLNKIGFLPEERPFLPHLTVARIKVGAGFGSIPYQKLESWKTRNFNFFSVNEFYLMESLLLSTGVVYKKVHSFSLEVLDGK
ncbi:MAG: RNA 2',3'-cyclic phosphodiesterase [Candidatus Ratteibacteria bacterium]|jgi:2'-5' RNA ligase